MNINELKYKLALNIESDLKQIFNQNDFLEYYFGQVIDDKYFALHFKYGTDEIIIFDFKNEKIICNGFDDDQIYFNSLFESVLDDIKEYNKERVHL